MLAVTAALAEAAGDRPPILLIHGAANSAGVWRFWQQALAVAGWSSFAIDLRGHGHSDASDLADTRMADYAADVRALQAQLARPPVLLGWSMGGLVALLAAARGGARACVGLAPSAPTRTTAAAAPLRRGEFGPAEYGIVSDDPTDQPAMPDLDHEERRVALASVGRESRLARDERAAGVIVTSLLCPLLIVTGGADREWPRARYANLSLPADFLEAAGASHWGLVLNRRALGGLVPGVTGWLERR